MGSTTGMIPKLLLQFACTIVVAVSNASWDCIESWTNHSNQVSCHLHSVYWSPYKPLLHLTLALANVHLVCCIRWVLTPFFRQWVFVGLRLLVWGLLDKFFFLILLYMWLYFGTLPDFSKGYPLGFSYFAAVVDSWPLAFWSIWYFSLFYWISCLWDPVSRIGACCFLALWYRYLR